MTCYISMYMYEFLPSISVINYLLATCYIIIIIAHFERDAYQTTYNNNNNNSYVIVPFRKYKEHSAVLSEVAVTQYWFVLCVNFDPGVSCNNIPQFFGI